MSYTIYNASAGSGKTYSLVKAYLQIVLSTPNVEQFRQLLAITFTNKAVFEMKNRIIELLGKFSEDTMLHTPHSMFNELCKSLHLTPKELQDRSAKTLEYILHNYAAFNISTIDGFNHQLIRHFSQDLHLNPFFEVQLDSQTLLERAVDNLMSQAGAGDKELTEWLIAFSNEKIDEDKNWDTSKELLEIAKMLTNENHYSQLQSLKDKELTDFATLKKSLTEYKEQAAQLIQTTALSFMQLLDCHGLDKGAFNGGHLYNFFQKLTLTPQKEPAWGSGWQTNLLDGEPMYGKTAAKKLDTALIDSLQPQIVTYFEDVRNAFGTLNFMQNALKYLPPLALLNRIQKEIALIKEEENILPIWEFNGVISSELSTQPAPFIYERIGEKFRHYFIDEFQDTSVLQWQNFIPLILNAVQSQVNHQTGSVLLVGDAKQSIYRWRGGKAEQFMSLYSGKENPFKVPLNTVNLAENYRSLKQIIDFNNAFFPFVANIFEEGGYRNLYEAAAQNYPKPTLAEGYVNISFINTVQEEEEEEREEEAKDDTLTPREKSYCEAILQKIMHANEAGADDKDITILVRTNKEGAAVASFLSSKGRKIISPDSLLLQNVPSVQFLIALLQLLYHPESEDLKAKMLFAFIRANGKGAEQPHTFLNKYACQPVSTFFADFGFSIETFNQYSLYEGVTLAVNCFEVARTSDAYLTHFIDLIFDFKNARKGGLADFLDFWEDQKEKLSISSPEGLNAITVMTVHKSKGLSAPVIIYAFADSKLEDNRGEMIWYPVSAENFAGFDYLLVKSSKNIENYGAASTILNEQHQQHLLDQINVLYVAMTRPESSLYVITSLPEKEINTYGTLLRDFLKDKGRWNEEITEYEYGTPILAKEKEETNADSYVLFQKGWAAPHYKIATGASLLWDTHQQQALERGNLIHSLFSQLTYATDLGAVLSEALQEGTLTEEQYQLLKPQIETLLSEPQIAAFFTDEYHYFIEREFVDSKGKYFRPDRIAYHPTTREAYLIDYKTGQPNPQYHQQLLYYAQNLQTIGWQVKGKYLVYLDEGTVVKC